MVDEPGEAGPRQARPTLGERLVELALLDVTGLNVSLYHPRNCGWRKAIFPARTPKAERAGLNGERESCTLLFDPLLRLEAKIGSASAAERAERAPAGSQVAFAARPSRHNGPGRRRRSACGVRSGTPGKPELARRRTRETGGSIEGLCKLRDAGRLARRVYERIR